MSPTLVLVVVLTFSFVVNRLIRRLAPHAFIPAGLVYPLIGLALGPYGVGLITRDILNILQPFISLLLGLLGFVMGLSLRRRLAESRGLEAGFLGGILTMGLVAGAVWALLFVINPNGSSVDHAWLGIALGAAASVSELAVIDGVIRRFGAGGPVSELLRAIVLATSVTAVVVFGFSLALARARGSSDIFGLTPTEWLLASLAVGIACGLLFHLFQGRQDDNQRTFLATVAVVTFAAGMAAGMGISPLLVNAVAGLTVSLASKRAARLAEVLEGLERPATISLYLIAGAMWSPVHQLMWLLPPLYLGMRFLALRAGTAVAVRVVGWDTPAPRLGNALLPQGGLAVAIALNFAQVYPLWAPEILTVVLLAVFFADVAGPSHVRRVLANSGEILHRSQPASETPAQMPQSTEGT